MLLFFDIVAFGQSGQFLALTCEQGQGTSPGFQKQAYETPSDQDPIRLGS